MFLLYRIALLYTEGKMHSTIIILTGPLARNVLSELTDEDLTTKAFPFFSFKEIDVGLANGIRAMNITHTGELGWVLYIPNEVCSFWELGILLVMAMEDFHCRNLIPMRILVQVLLCYI